MERQQTRYCVFCEIVAGREPATIRYQDAEVVVFENRLRWAPVMLLVVPRQHVTQDELWSNGTIARLGTVAVEMGVKWCPKGFRILSNFGHDAMQSQEHGHIHLLGGMHLGPYA
ncbi:MAG: HIT domain-containing protein [Chloroflexi bacterium]|nr:HIT domain-containing protein [Chloroflexota bacterium]